MLVNACVHYTCATRNCRKLQTCVWLLSCLGQVLVITGHLTYFLKNLYVGQEARVRTGYGTTDWFKIAKVIQQGCILSPCLFNFYAEYIMWNAGLDASQAGIKIAGRNINDLRYADVNTLMAETEEELKSLLMRVYDKSEKPVLKLNIQKTKNMAMQSHLFISNRRGKHGNNDKFYFLRLQNHCGQLL